ncbi:MAG: glycerol kinase [Treponema sp.]|jgi:glycerol kinase|nr:glycerol kinase [Treponema sp.]
MDGPFILAIDQSTSGTKALLFDAQGDILCRADRPHAQKISANGWIAHDPVEIYRNTLAAVADLLRKSGVDGGEIIGAGISNQRETAMVWDRAAGQPVYDAVVWQCPRGAEICGRLAADAETIRARTGMPLSPYFSAAKIAWILEHTGNTDNPGLCAGTIDSWLVYKLTGNFKTDWSNASRTQLLNLAALRWDEELCGLFGISPAMLPRICDSDSLFGLSDFEGILPRPAPLRAVTGDSHGALFAQGCLERGMAKATYGTGSSVMVNVGAKPVFCKSLATSLAWGRGGAIDYVLEGNINYAGAVIKWLVEDLGLLSSSKEAGPLAQAANPADTSYLVPAFSGLGAPHWVSGARACLCGMSRSTGRAEIVRAAEESIAYQIADVVRAIQEEGGVSLAELRADGGAAGDSFLMQFQSDILKLPLSVPGPEELSAMGAAYMAGIALGLYSPAVLSRCRRTRYSPRMDGETRDRRYQGWRNALRMVKDGGVLWET